MLLILLVLSYIFLETEKNALNHNKKNSRGVPYLRTQGRTRSDINFQLIFLLQIFFSEGVKNIKSCEDRKWQLFIIFYLSCAPSLITPFYFFLLRVHITKIGWRGLPSTQLIILAHVPQHKFFFWSIDLVKNKIYELIIKKQVIIKKVRNWLRMISTQKKMQGGKNDSIFFPFFWRKERN